MIVSVYLDKADYQLVKDIHGGFCYLNLCCQLSSSVLVLSLTAPFSPSPAGVVSASLSVRPYQSESRMLMGGKLVTANQEARDIIMMQLCPISA